MPDTKDVGPFYAHLLRGPLRGFAGKAWTHEVEAPYRRGAGFSIRLAPRTALVLGRWHKMARDEDEALLAALGASSLEIDVTEIKGWDGGVRQEDPQGADLELDLGEADLSPGYPRIHSLD